MENKIYKAAVFDFDYTLVDASPGIIRSYNRAFAEFGYPVFPDELLKKTIGAHVIDSFRLLTGCRDDEISKRFYAAFVREADVCMTAMTEFLPGAERLLERLRDAGIPCGIVTTKPGYRITGFFDRVGKPGLISFVIGSDGVSRCKPDPEGLLAASAKLSGQGVKKNEVLYAGDNIIDAQAASAAGVNFAAVLTGTTERAAFDEYPHIAAVDNIAGLSGFFGL